MTGILFFSNTLIQGREAKCANLLAENDIITPDGLKAANLSYTLITQREPDNQVKFSFSEKAIKIYAGKRQNHKEDGVNFCGLLRKD